MSRPPFFNSFVENLVEKTAKCYGKVNDWKSFLLFAPTCSISTKRRRKKTNSFSLPCLAGETILPFLPAALGKVLAPKELLCQMNCDRALNSKAPTRISLPGAKGEVAAS
jgi:hypothetical protein